MRKLRDPLLMLLAGAIGALAMALAVGLPSAEAASTTTDNPWTFQMTNPGQQGLVIVGPTSGNTQLFEAKDGAGNPIFAINAAGGAAVLGDDFKVFAPGDVFNPVITLHKEGTVTLGLDGPTLRGTVGNPTGACTAGEWAFTKTTARIYACVSGVWVRKA